MLGVIRRFHVKKILPCRVPCVQVQCYCNPQFKRQDESESSHTEQKLTESILNNSVKLVPSSGWTIDTMYAGADQLNVPAHTVDGLFPRGPIQLVCHFYRDCNKKMVEKIRSDLSVATTTTDQKDAVINKPSQNNLILSALRFRLSLLEPVVSTWHEAMALIAHPKNADIAWPLIVELVDDVWFEVGDRSINMSWYTKRGSLACIYKSAEFYMLQDRSPQFLDTTMFLEKNFHDIVHVGLTLGTLKFTASTAGNILTYAPIIIKNMLGIR